MDAQAWIGLAISFLAVLVAIVVPLVIERAKWPDLHIERADDATLHMPPVAQFVHVKVTNVPLTDIRRHLLQRDTARGCKVEFTFRSKSDGKGFSMPGRWSATPQPLTLGHFDNEMVPQSLRFDLSPDEQGETLAMAIKRDGDANAYGFNSYSYANELTLCLPRYALPDEIYDVDVRAHAGPVEARRSFVLHNAGQHHRGLQIRPRMLRLSRKRRSEPWPVMPPDALGATRWAWPFN